MTSYLIEFRVRGYAKRYAKELIFDVGRKFRVRGMTHKNPVPHITLYGPFNTNNEKKVISEIQNLCRKYDRIYFSFRGFNYFNNSTNKVIYLDITPSLELKRFREELALKLKPITSTKSKEDAKNKENFKFHSTIAFKDIDNKFSSIWSHIDNKKKPNIRQTLLRITILKNGRILYEYDFLQKRLLNRRQALNKQIFRETIKKLKQKSYPSNIIETKIIKPKEPTIWMKIKSLFNSK
jgi:2'-5' RNA ligase